MAVEIGVDQQARDRNPYARELYSKLEYEIVKFPSLIVDEQTPLDELKGMLKEIPKNGVKFSICLRDLKAHRTSLVTNIANYATCLGKIAAIGDYPQSWNNFLNQDCKRWQTQIETDIEFLSPGQDLFGRMIDTIRGIVAIEQAEIDRLKAKTDKKRDRYLTIGSFGVGSAALVTGNSILSAQSAPHIKAIEEIPLIKESLYRLNLKTDLNKKVLADTVIAFAFSITTELIVAGITALILQITQPRHNLIMNKSKKALPSSRE
jgi:hypothetical protein